MAVMTDCVQDHEWITEAATWLGQLLAFVREPDYSDRASDRKIQPNAAVMACSGAVRLSGPVGEPTEAGGSPGS